MDKEFLTFTGTVFLIGWILCSRFQCALDNRNNLPLKFLQY